MSKKLEQCQIREWIISRISAKIEGEKLVELLQALWILAESLKEVAEEKIGFVKMRAKTQGVTITAVSTSCNKKSCYCGGKPMHFPYIKIYKDGRWQEIKQKEVESFLSHYLDQTDTSDFLSICYIRNNVLRVYSKLGKILASLGVVENE